MSARFSRLFVAWITLLFLLVIEIAASFVHMPRSFRPLILIVAASMAAVIATCFMEVNRGPDLVRLFAIAGLVWLAILLSLGSLDPLTRYTYPNAPDGALHLKTTSVRR
jgi:cytochrome c oxidase subunit 4